MIGVLLADTPPAVPTNVFSLLVPIFLALVSIAYIAPSKMLGMHHIHFERQQSFAKTCLNSLVNALDQQRKKIDASLHDYIVHFQLSLFSHVPTND